MIPPYEVIIYWSDEDKCFIADVPELRFCTAHGPTHSKALEEVQVAMLGWLEMAQEMGHKIPEPQRRPAFSP